MVKAPGNKISRGLFTVNDFEFDTITTGKCPALWSIGSPVPLTIDDQISCGIYLIGRLKEVQINQVHVSGRRLDAQLLSPVRLDLLIGNGPSHAGIGCETGNPTAD